MPQISPLSWVLIPFFFFCFFLFMMVGVWWVFKNSFEFSFFCLPKESDEISVFIWKW